MEKYETVETWNVVYKSDSVVIEAGLPPSNREKDAWVWCCKVTPTGQEPKYFCEEGSMSESEAFARQFDELAEIRVGLLPY